MEKKDIIKIYNRYASVYDFIFSRVFSPRINHGLEKINIKNGDTIIEVGVGTGLSLSLYPHGCTVVGIDIARKMLEKAQKKTKRLNLKHVHLFEMDAENVMFKDDSFDHAVLPFVITVVPNIEKVVAEVKRVVKKNGNIIIVNHFCNNHSFFTSLEKFVSPFFMKLGWKTGIPIEFISNHCNVHVKEISKRHSFDLWPLIHAVNKK